MTCFAGRVEYETNLLSGVRRSGRICSALLASHQTLTTIRFDCHHRLQNTGSWAFCRSWRTYFALCLPMGLHPIYTVHGPTPPQLLGSGCRFDQYVVLSPVKVTSLDFIGFLRPAKLPRVIIWLAQRMLCSTARHTNGFFSALCS